MKATSTIRYVLYAAIVLILVAAASWYFFIRAKQAEITREDAGRGAGLSPPSFTSRVGSTYENIVSSLSSTITGERESENRKELLQLLEVSKTPTAGAGFVVSGTSTHLRFVERSTGHIFDAALGDSALERLTNTLVPHTYEASISINGRTIMRSTEEDGEVVVATARIATSTSAEDSLRPLVRTFLPAGAQSVVASPTGEEIFYILKTEEGVLGVRAAWNGTNPKQIFSSAVAGWQAHWLPDNRIVIVQKPSDGVTGYAYEIGGGGELLPLVRGVPGLTVLPHPSLRALLWGQSAGRLSLHARVSATTTDALLPIRTTADKCVWNPRLPLVAYCAVPQREMSSNFLDRWYRGEEHDADAWWRVDASTASAELLLAPSNTTIDVESPTIDPSGQYIAFINALNKSLWLLRIAE